MPGHYTEVAFIQGWSLRGVPLYYNHGDDHGVIDCRSFPKSLDTFEPDIVVYNAGTDVLIGDSLGRLDITPKVRMRGGS